MSKKLLISIFLILFLIVGFIAYFELSNSTIKVGDTTFNMPKGYHKGTQNFIGAINITDGNSTVFLDEVNGSNIVPYINNYKKLIKTDRNQTVIVTNYTVDGELIYKGTIKENPKCIHCWFVKNNKTYDIYTWDANKDLDSIVINCLKS